MIDAYTRLLEQVAETADEKTAEVAVSKLVAHLKSTGRVKMLSSIRKELKKIAHRRKLQKTILEVASKEEEKEALQEALQEGVRSDVVRVNGSLLKGWRAVSNKTLVDRSAKQSLLTIYKRVTS